MAEQRTMISAVGAPRRGGWRRGMALAALSLGFLLLATRPARGHGRAKGRP